jgi:hypothetical protein
MHRIYPGRNFSQPPKKEKTSFDEKFKKKE